MGYNQPFKIVSLSGRSLSDEGASVDKGASMLDSASDPIEILKAEHLGGAQQRLENLEEQLRLEEYRRSLDGNCADLENEITLHSVKKEEEGLFPLLMKKNPMAQAFVQIVHEDHKEFISLCSTPSVAVFRRIRSLTA